MYNWQCLNGHCGSIPQGSPLEKKAKIREGKGYLDAIILPPHQCPQCLKEKQHRLQENISLCMSMDCEERGQAACLNCYVGELQKVEKNITSSETLFASPNTPPQKPKKEKPQKGLTSLGDLLKEAGL